MADHANVLNLSSSPLARNEMKNSLTHSADEHMTCNKQAPTVSLAMPVYNGGQYIGEAIQSILDQTFEDFELIITDNASTDDTQQICLDFAEKDPRVRYHRNPQNLGAAGNYNRGFELARGEFLKWCAHDDNISPSYVEEAVRALNENEDAIMAYGRTQMIDSHGTHLDGSASAILTDMGNPNSVKRFMQAVHAGGSCSAIFALFRKSELARSTLHRGYYQSDRALLSEMALLGTFEYLPEIVFYNREHETRSMSLDDKIARAKWQNTKSSGRFAFEQWPLSWHYFQIVFRHAGTVGLHRTLPPILLWSISPAQLSRYFLELVSVVSPTASVSLRQFFLKRFSKG